MFFRMSLERFDKRYRRIFPIIPYKLRNNVIWLETAYICQYEGNDGKWYDSRLATKAEYINYKEQRKWKGAKHL